MTRVSLDQFQVAFYFERHDGDFNCVFMVPLYAWVVILEQFRYVCVCII